MPELPDLPALIADLDARTADRGDLDRLEAAEEIADELTALGARLVGYYVEQARTRGNSWTDIGGHLGISRQAAQQRYTPARFQLTLGDLISTGALSRLTDRTRTTLVRAEEHAKRLGGATVEPRHVLLAMLDDGDTLAVQALARLDVDVAGLRAVLDTADAVDAPNNAVGSRDAAPHVAAPNFAAPHATAPPLGTPARRLLEAALAQALKLNHNYIGTEHLLLALASVHTDPTAQLLADRGAGYDRVREAVHAVIDEYLRTR
ncbi:Clp protease N-terminal domain-containing protein [Catenulispora pinisilvae]|uniref:Clp protease N-terminal domain-containing protein n=1 Tax=Catenulispora pinisilvae TaxID=2705253 RepID=UPI001891F53F|nr:Clp protease N-terminal domain-containing protein [Catenulispora pinisilvae]